MKNSKDDRDLPVINDVNRALFIIRHPKPTFLLLQHYL